MVCGSGVAERTQALSFDNGVLRVAVRRRGMEVGIAGAGAAVCGFDQPVYGRNGLPDRVRRVAPGKPGQRFPLANTIHESFRKRRCLCRRPREPEATEASGAECCAT